jgi:hypothetical protein
MNNETFVENCHSSEYSGEFSPPEANLLMTDNHKLSLIRFILNKVFAEYAETLLVQNC